MERQDLLKYIKEKYGVDPEYPWDDRNAVVRHPGNNKWFALVMEIKRSKLGLPDDAEIDIVNLKSDPMLISTLRSNPGFFPAYHMNKENWLSVALDGTAPDEEIKNLLDMSYQMVAPKKQCKYRLSADREGVKKRDGSAGNDC